MKSEDYEQFASKALKAPSPLPRLNNYIYAKPQYPSRQYPREYGTDERRIRNEVQNAIPKPGLMTLVKSAINKEKEIEKLKADTEAMKKKKWKIPFKWTSTANKAAKNIDTVCVMYLNIKGEIEPPMILPIHGNMVLIRNKVYEVDPRAFWILRQGGKMFKFLIIKEIDRRPVSNLDLDEIKRRGDATDSDEFLIKMALRAQQTAATKQVSKWVAIAIGIVVLAILVYFFAK